jgi:NADH-quinone oxidoreductase subunit E
MEILLDKLHETQDKYGYLPEDEIIRIADEQGIPKAELFGIITFYSRFYLEPVEKYIIRICKSVSCGINHAGAILEKVSEYLEIEDEKSKDGLFRLETVECLGHCGEGPVMTINDEVYRTVTPEKAVEIISSYQRKG